MEEKNLFSIARSGTTALCITFLLLMAIGQINDLLFPSPRYVDYVTETSYPDAQTDAQKEAYRKQYDAYCEAKKGPDFSRFFVRSGASVLFIFAGITLSMTALATAFIAAGTIGLCYAFIEHGSGLPTPLRLVFLFLTISLLCFILYRWGKKNSNDITGRQ
jgi:hypothetical protein